MSTDQDKTAPPRTMSVPAAGKKYFNIGRDASYRAAKRGEMPTIKIGNRILALPLAIERMLEGNSPK
jgi:hypothetical protein